MKIRIEFTKNKSPHWAWVLRILKKQIGYGVICDAGVDVHWVDLTEHDFPLLAHLEDLTQSWRTVNWIIDGVFETRFRALELVFGEFSKISTVEAAIWKAKREALKKSHEERTRSSQIILSPSDAVASV